MFSNNSPPLLVKNVAYPRQPLICCNGGVTLILSSSTTSHICFSSFTDNVYILCLSCNIKDKKQLPNLLKRIETNVVTIIFNYVLVHAHDKLVALSMLVLHESIRWKKNTFMLHSKCDDFMIILLHSNLSVYSA